MFAPLMHPAMRHVGPVRRDLAIPTMMNVLGPLANPAGAGRQVVGVADASRLPLIAGALAALGSVHAMVVHGEPGLDEVSPLGTTHVLEVQNARVREWTIEPGEHVDTTGTAADLAGATPAENAEIITAVLSRKRGGLARSAVVLNAGAAIYVSGKARDFGAGVRAAGEALDRGEGIKALERLRAVTGQAPRTP